MIVGGGPAGLGAAVALCRSRRSVLVIDSGEPRNARAGHVHNYLAREHTPPSELTASGRAEVTGYGGTIRAGSATSARRIDGGFRVSLADGTDIRARRLLVATGLVDELPDVPGVAERFGRDVLHCPYCHGWEVRDRAIGVLATGPMAVHQALLFSQLSDDVLFFRHTEPAPGDADAAKLAARGIQVVTGEVVGLDVRDDRLTGVLLGSGDVVAREALTVAPRFTARADVLTSLGVSTTDMEMGGQVVGTYVPSDPTGATSVPGVWVAGNVTDPTGQVITSAAAGMRAGAVINADLVEEDSSRVSTRA